MSYKVDDKVWVAVDSNTACNFMKTDSGIYTEGTIICDDHGCYAIAFKQKINRSVWLVGDRFNSKSQHQYPSFSKYYADYTYAYWMYPDTNFFKIKDRSRVSSSNSDGCSCKKCKEYYAYAIPNQSDGTLLCYSCRVIYR